MIGIQVWGRRYVCTAASLAASIRLPVVQKAYSTTTLLGATHAEAQIVLEKQFFC